MATLLDLPVELLQLIAEHAPDIPALRLTCQTLNLAVLDPFGKKYLSHLECFLLDPRRLLRIKCITSQKHLVSRVNRVSFTLDALENKLINEIPTVSERTRDGSMDFFEVLQQHACKTYKHRRMNMVILRSILEDIRIAGRARIDIVFAGYEPNYVHSCHFVLDDADVAEMFDNISTSGCILSGLNLTRTAFLKAALENRPTSRQRGFLQEKRSWERLRIDVAGQTLQDQTLISTLRCAKSLRDLVMVDDGPLVDAQNARLPRAWPFTNTILTAISSPALRKVDLSYMAIDPASLYQALQSWSNSLRSLTLWDVYLTSPGDQWLKILELLYSSFAELEELTLSDLMEESRTVIRSDASIRADFVELQACEEEFERCVGRQIELSSRQQVMEALRLSVESGLVDTCVNDDTDL